MLYRRDRILSTRPPQPARQTNEPSQLRTSCYRAFAKLLAEFEFQSAREVSALDRGQITRALLFREFTLLCILLPMVPCLGIIGFLNAAFDLREAAPSLPRDENVSFRDTNVQNKM